MCKSKLINQASLSLFQRIGKIFGDFFDQLDEAYIQNQCHLCGEPKWYFETSFIGSPPLYIPCFVNLNSPCFVCGKMTCFFHQDENGVCEICQKLPPTTEKI